MEKPWTPQPCAFRPTPGPLPKRLRRPLAPHTAYNYHPPKIIPLSTRGILTFRVGAGINERVVVILIPTIRALQLSYDCWVLILRGWGYQKRYVFGCFLDAPDRGKAIPLQCLREILQKRKELYRRSRGVGSGFGVWSKFHIGI